MLEERKSEGEFTMFGEKIRDIRKSYNLSQVQLAEKLSVKKQTVCNWEKENVSPSVDMLRKMAVYFACTSDYLLDLDQRIFVEVGELTLEQRAHIQTLIDDMKELNRAAKIEVEKEQ